MAFNYQRVFPLAVLLASTCCSPTEAVADKSRPPTVTIENGPLNGFVGSHHAERFWGVPYAKRPTGKRRLRAPASLAGTRWTKPYSATKHRSICLQMNIRNAYLRGSEDCLYLDVTRPRGAREGDDLPVLVWIPGGAFVVGDGYQSSFYDPAPLVHNNNLLFVAVNHRLSMLGFMALPDLEGEGLGSGLFGLLDQQAALHWVQRNIRSFGGDPNRVTLVGQSAGGTSVFCHLVAPSSRGLFTAAIMVSAALSPLFLQTKVDAIKFYEFYVDHWGCNEPRPGDAAGSSNRLDCLRRLPAKKFVIPLDVPKGKQVRPSWGSPLFPMMPLGPVIDGTVLPGDPLTLMKKGCWNNVTFLASATADDGSLFSYAVPAMTPGARRPFSEETVRAMLSWWLQDPVKEHDILEVYSDVKGRWSLMLDYLIRDFWFSCPLLEFMRAARDTGGDAHLATFSYDFSALREFRKVGTVHISDLLFYYGNKCRAMAWAPHIRLRDRVEHLSASMQCLWASMAHHRTPVPSTGKVCPSGVEIDFDFPEFGHNETYLSLRQDGGETDFYEYGPMLKMVQADNRYDPQDRYSNEFPSSRKCKMLSSLPPVAWRDLRNFTEEQPWFISKLSERLLPDSDSLRTLLTDTSLAIEGAIPEAAVAALMV